MFYSGHQIYKYTKYNNSKYNPITIKRRMARFLIIFVITVSAMMPLLMTNGRRIAKNIPMDEPDQKPNLKSVS